MQSGLKVQLEKVVRQQNILADHQPTVFTDYAIRRSSTIMKYNDQLYILNFAISQEK